MLFRVERWHEVSLIGWFALKLVAKKKFTYFSVEVLVRVFPLKKRKDRVLFSRVSFHVK